MLRKKVVRKSNLTIRYHHLKNKLLLFKENSDDEYRFISKCGISLGFISTVTVLPYFLESISQLNPESA